jgi:hypothetical protein
MAAPVPRPIVLELALARAPDMAMVDALARLALEARRAGLGLRLARAPRELIALAGLEGALCLEPCGHAEEREQAIGVEEERQLADPPA